MTSRILKRGEGLVIEGLVLLHMPSVGRDMQNVCDEIRDEPVDDLHG